MSRRFLTSPLAITLALALTCATCAVLTACGSSASPHPKPGSAGSAGRSTASSTASTTAPSAANPPASEAAAINPNDPKLSEVIATVAHGKPITRGALLRWMEIGGATRKEGREPSSVIACVQQMTNTQIKTPSELQGSCKKSFQGYMESALSSLIHNQWLLGEAADRGLSVNESELRTELEKSLGPPGSKLKKAMLAQTDQTLPEVELNLKLGQLSDRLYEQTEAKIPKLTQARLSSYYAEHKGSYAVPLERDLHIIRFSSDASARKALEELRAGKSFASVAKGVSVDQPLGATDGLLRGLSHEGFKQPTLADAIFRAKPGAIVGPVKIYLGSYVFEVIAIHQPRHRSFAEVGPEIRKELPRLLRDQTLSTAVGAFKRKWVARTSCRAGWVVQNCREYKVIKGSEAYDAYTF